MRKPLIAGNWKMFKTLDEAVSFVSELKQRLGNLSGREILLIPPYPFLYPVSEVIKGTGLFPAG